MRKIYILSAAFFCLSLFFMACKQERKLPYYGDRHVESVKNVDGTEKIDTIYKTIPNWSFLNQDSVLTTNKITDGKIYIADFFFTSCSTICPTMHRNLMKVYQEFKDNPNVIFVSHTIDFKYDKPSVLKKYATKLGVDNQKWQFLYGSKDSVYKLAEKDYLVAVGEDSTAKDGYIHQGYLVLVDQQRHVRGAYDGTLEEQVEKLRKDIPVLLAESKN